SGLLSTVPSWPAVQAVLLTILVLTGAGSAVMCWVRLPPAAAVAAVVGVSVAAVVALATSLIWLGLWHPAVSCAALSIVVFASGLCRLQRVGREGDGGNP